jgi:glycine/D-amino acid oxidase-like deaminating enzyme
MPDTLPVIGRAPHHGNVVLAFGHGQIGMTLGATTGQLVAELVTHEKPSVDLAPFRPERFSSRSCDHKPPPFCGSLLGGGLVTKLHL